LDLIEKTFNQHSKRLPSISEISKCVLFDHEWSSEKIDKTFQIRSEYTKYNFFILSHEFLSNVATMCSSLKTQKIVELGAGAGWFSYWLSLYGVPVCESIDNMSWESKWNSVLKMVKKKSAINFVKENPQIELFLLSWPYMDSFALRVWKAMQKGQYLFYIGEGKGGCTANDDFFSAVDKYKIEDKWGLEKSFVSFWAIHDRPILFKKGER